MFSQPQSCPANRWSSAGKGKQHICGRRPVFGRRNDDSKHRAGFPLKNPYFESFKNISLQRPGVKPNMSPPASILGILGNFPTERLSRNIGTTDLPRRLGSLRAERHPISKGTISVTSRLAPFLWLALALACGTVFAQESIRWAPDINSARRASAEFKVPLLIHFYGDGCLPCKTLEQRVLSQSEVISTLNKFFICVKVNATQDRQVAAEFQVHSWPTDVFVSPDGKTLYQGVCQQDVRAYTNILENVKVMNRDRNVMLAATQPVQPQNGIAQQVAPMGAQNMTPGLPPPGTNLATRSTTPSFYGDQNSGTQTVGQQQLPPSMPPTQFVQSGPLLANTQPQAIGGSTPGAQQQLQQPPAPSFMNTPNGQLPLATAPQGRLASPVDERIAAAQRTSLPNAPATNQMSQSLGMPQTDAPSTNRQTSVTLGATQAGPTANDARGANWSQANLAQATTGQAVDNPYYQRPQAAEATPAASNWADSGASRGTIPAQQVSFQPRSNSTNNTSTVNEQASAQSGTNVAASTANPPAAATESGKPALDGYCPVALRSTGGWTQGDPRFAVRHRGRVYWLSNEEARNEFLKAPDNQSPVLSGYDPMLFLNGRTPGRRERAMGIA
jgi:thiol-disulfide isomerase/thioredoxin